MAMLGSMKEPYLKESASFYVWNGIAMFVLGFVPATAVVVWLLKKDSFAFTHYPIRLNRKTRMVHVHRTDGTTLSTPWDAVFFTLGYMPQWNESEVRGHILDTDGVTVKETFGLGVVGAMSAADRAAPEGKRSIDVVLAHWEFVRRYMEEGPQSISDQIQFCMPVAVGKESAKGSFERMFANMSGAPIIAFIVMCPFLLLFSVGRVIAMKTSKIPVWPREILASSSMPDDDPYAITGDDKGERTPVFPSAALAAGVCFKPAKP